MPIARDHQQFANILNALGAPAALAYLNAGVPHRYSAIYRLQDGMFENIYLHDKQGDVVPEFLAVVPFEVSFCQFVLRDSAFRADDSAADRRLDRHKYQGVVASYHGVPILDETGELAGTPVPLRCREASSFRGRVRIASGCRARIPSSTVATPAQAWH